MHADRIGYSQINVLMVSDWSFMVKLNGILQRMAWPLERDFTKSEDSI